MPEFNPFKYNSFPTNAARQSFLLTKALQKQIVTDSRNHRLNSLPPVLTFQSVVDSTVSTRAIVTALYNRLPDNGSEIVLFDLNHAVRFNSLLRRTSYTALARLLPAAPRTYQTTIITNANSASTEMEIRTTRAGKTDTTVENCRNALFTGRLLSFSCRAPFPLSDSLYGRYPHPLNQYGISLGTFAARGERSVLVVGLDSLMRQSSNPFFPYMIKRIDEGIDTRPALSGK